MTNNKEIYTLVGRSNFGAVNFTYFSNREKMKEIMLRYIRKGDECYVIPGLVELVGFRVKYEDDHAIDIFMEDEPDYIAPPGELECS